MDVDISVSLELLILLGWLVKNEKQLLDNMVRQSLKNGLLQKLNTASDLKSVDVVEQFYPTMIDFLSIIDNSLMNNLEKTSQHSTQELLPILKKINFSDIDLQTIYLSSGQAKQKVKTNNNDRSESQQLLLQQILKNWKPNKKDCSN